MTRYRKWMQAVIILNILILTLALAAGIGGMPTASALIMLVDVLFTVVFVEFWKHLKEKGFKNEIDINRILGKEVKEGLLFGQIGIVTYDSDLMITWSSDYFKQSGFQINNKKLTNWIPQLEEICSGQVDTLTVSSQGIAFEVKKAPNQNALLFKNISELQNLEQMSHEHILVAGMADLNNYSEYQAHDDEVLLSAINTHLRTLLLNWAKANNMLIRRIHSDRYLLITDLEGLNALREQNFPILQQFKDKAKEIEVTMTLSIAFVYGTYNFVTLSDMLNELLDLINSRGGDQIGIKEFEKPVEFIGGNSEMASERSTVRVKIVTDTIEDLIKKSNRVFVLGHTQTDYDCFGAAMAVSNWAKALHKDAYIVLKDVSRDKHLEETMHEYRQALSNRHNLITRDEALRLFSPEEDLLVLVDHGVPSLSSGQELLETADNIVVIDHHRKGEKYVSNPTFSYVESKASSTSELLTELIQNSNVTVPIYEAEATMMYLGMVVDTNRFKQHTSERTHQAAAVLRGWGANMQQVQNALQEDIGEFISKNRLYAMAAPYRERFMIMAIDEPVDRTLLSQVADQLLNIKGIQASFVLGQDESGRDAMVSSRSDGSFNVQIIMEKLGGGGHFSAAATRQNGILPSQLAEKLKEELDKAIKSESS